jgi:hypothetical protein
MTDNYAHEEVEKIIERMPALRAKWLSIVEDCMLSMQGSEQTTGQYKPEQAYQN